VRKYATRITALLILAVLVVPAVSDAQTGNVQGVVDTLLNKYKSAGETWAGSIQSASTNLFWLLATISLGWTCISMAVKQSDLVEIVAELCRFIMVTGLFFWLLTNGPTFANDIIHSLWQVGGQASGSGNAIYPMALINLGMQVFVQEIGQINILMPAATGIPGALAVIILIVCGLIACNMILLLCAAWIVVYAGLIFLGFGGCRWTSDMAINYYRTVLGVGVSLMVMQLIIGIGIQFLQQLVSATGTTPDAGQVALIMVATIILAVISHRLPHMVAGIILGGGNNGAIGGIGIMNVFAGAMMGASLAGRMGGNPAAAVAIEGVGEGAKMLQDRISAVEAAMGSQQSRATTGADTSSTGGGATAWSFAGGRSTTGGSAAAPGRQSGRGGASSGFGGSSTGKLTGASASGEQSNRGSVKPEPPEPPLERPMSPDEQRGFGPDGNGDPSDNQNKVS
jgi:type IV secretion system protein TrbL